MLLAMTPAIIGCWLLLTMGEGWHNNHHAYQSSARQGFRWWEIDVTFYILVTLSWLGIVWDLKTPPQKVLCNEHRLGSRAIKRTAEQLAERFNPEAIALAIKSSAHEIIGVGRAFSIATSDQLTPAIHAKSRRATG